MLSDVTGPFYTIVLELTVPNMSTFDSYGPKLFGDKDWQANYQKLTPLVESGIGRFHGRRMRSTDRWPIESGEFPGR